MKDIDKELNDILKQTDAVFKNMNSQMDDMFKQMDQIFKEAEKIKNVARKTEVGPWKEWFAWRPVKIKNKRIWMKKVYRRSINTYVDQDDWTRYEYGDIFDVLKEAGSKQSSQADEVQQGPA